MATIRSSELRSSPGQRPLKVGVQRPSRFLLVPRHQVPVPVKGDHRCVTKWGREALAFTSAAITSRDAVPPRAPDRLGRHGRHASRDG